MPAVRAPQLVVVLAPWLHAMVVVSNRPGASGLPGVRGLLNAASDGHTLVYFGSPQLALLVALKA